MAASKITRQQLIAHRVCIKRCENALRARLPSMFATPNSYVPRCHYVKGYVGCPIGNVERVVQMTVDSFGDRDNVRVTDIAMDKFDRLIIYVMYTL